MAESVLVSGEGVLTRHDGPIENLRIPGNQTVDGDLVLNGQVVESNADLDAWRSALAQSRAGGKSAAVLWIGDSIVEGFATTKWGNRWLDRLHRRMMGNRRGGHRFIPAAAGAGGTGSSNGDWAGGDSPWAYVGSVTRADSYGFGRRALNLPSAATATISWFGDRALVWYTQTTDGPTAATVTYDGVAQTPIDGRNPTVVSGLAAGVFGAEGAYGLHTLVITPNDGPLVLEGASVMDNDIVFLGHVNTVQFWEAARSGYKAADHLAVTNWVDALSQNNISLFLSLVVIEVGVADYFGAVTAAEYEEDLVALVDLIDTEVMGAGSPPEKLPSVLFVAMPGLQGEGHAAAQRRAAERIGLERARAVDLAAKLPNREFGTILSDDSLHPNDNGHIWLADRMAEILDPVGVPQPTVPDTNRIVIDASTPPTYRSAWTESWAAISATALGRDASPATGVAERRHRVWLEPGTYRATVTMQEDTGLGNVEVLIGRWVEADPSLVSCGTVTNAAGTPTLVTTRLATSVTTEVAGWHPVVIRRTGTGAVRFVQLVVDKTA